MEAKACRICSRALWPWATRLGFVDGGHSPVHLVHEGTVHPGNLRRHPGFVRPVCALPPHHSKAPALLPLAASMAALRARRLVWSATSEMSSSTRPMPLAASATRVTHLGFAGIFPRCAPWPRRCAPSPLVRLRLPPSFPRVVGHGFRLLAHLEIASLNSPMEEATSSMVAEFCWLAARRLSPVVVALPPSPAGTG